MFASLQLLMICCVLRLTSLTSAVTITFSGSSVANLGESYTIICSADSSSTSYTYQWLQDGQPIENSGTLSFSSVSLDDAGDMYECVVRDGDTEVGRRSFTFNVTIPGFRWLTKRSPNSQHYAGQAMNISCIGILSNTNNLRANFSILDPQGNPIPSGVKGDRVRVFALMPVATSYETRLEFTALSAGDDGTYTCTGTVMPAVPNPNVINGVNAISFDILIQAIFIGLNIEEDTLLPRLLDSAPYNQLTLSCIADMRVRLVPTEFTVNYTWWRSVDGGPEEEIPSEEFTNARVTGSNPMSQLSVSVSQPSILMYHCRVALDLRPAPDHQSNEIQTNITVYGPSPPDAPVNMTFPIVLHNHAVVQWSIPTLTYDPETYVVYYGISESVLDQHSVAVMTTSVELMGLQVETRYYVRVQANNSIGSATSDVHTFTTASLVMDPVVMEPTLSGVLVGSPINDNFFTGLQLNLTCFITISYTIYDHIQHVDIHTTWTTSASTINNDINRNVVELYEVGAMQYQTSILFNSLQKTRDEGQYTCTIMAVFQRRNISTIRRQVKLSYDINIQTIYFQLLLTGISDCESWKVVNPTSKIADIETSY